MASIQLKKTDEAEFYKSVFVGLIDAMLKTGDGKTQETAIFSVGINEQYVLMSYLGFTRESKDLVRSDGHIYDVHTSYNAEKKERRKFWFNIDEVFGKF